MAPERRKRGEHFFGHKTNSFDTFLSRARQPPFLNLCLSLISEDLVPSALVLLLCSTRTRGIDRGPNT